MALSENRSTRSDGEQKLSAPSISLPKGGGAIRGMGEKFGANPVTGTGSMSVPIVTSPGRSGFDPQLSLSYDSGAGNGPFGMGWSLSLPSITRKTEKGLPQYRDAKESDVYILSGSEDLVPVLQADGSCWSETRMVAGREYRIHRYQPRIEGLFARIERWTDVATGEIHWRSITRDNVTTLYGKDNNSRIFDPGHPDPNHPTRIFSWLICQSYDDKGNAIVYEYALENEANVDLSQANERNRVRTANRYLKRIKYGNRIPNRDQNTWQGIDPTELPDDTWMFEVVFDYDEGHLEEFSLDPGRPEAEQHRFVHASATALKAWPVRPDPFSSYRAGFEVRTYRLCQRVLMFHHIPDLPTGEKGYDGLVRSTDFTYAYEKDPTHAKTPVYSRLVSVTQSGYTRQEDGRYLKKSLPPLEFTYSDPVVQDAVEEVDAESLENLPIGLDGTSYQWTDLHGEGLPGILTEQGGAWFYKRNLSPINGKPGNGGTHTEAKFAPLEQVATKPNLALGGGAQFMDLDGDGQPDLVVMEGSTPGLYEHDEDEGWQSFRPFTARLERDLNDPNLRFVDLNGDGHADVLITEDDAFVWHPLLAEAGFGPARRVAQALDEEKGPRLVFADSTQSIYLADLSGDGLTDLVRIRNGEVCYWPNLGYGRFGAKVTMDNAPLFDAPDQFDQRRIRLADIDGTGTTDIIYLHRNGVRLYFNQSGNSWSSPQVLHVFPEVDNLVDITAVDLLGNGTACLVWSSPLPGDAGRQMRYVNLMGGQKPHLLIKSVNNLGAETRVHYAPSTKFYLEDKEAGKPWITRLPFPVHVVERVETYDHISRNRFITRYAYHHGYFDGEEREFRGFGMVEQWDTEEYGAFTEEGEFPRGDNWDKSSHMPPVYTKTWFHTGAYFGRKRVSRHYEQEYYREPGLTLEEARELLLPDTILPGGLAAEEEREACRALKGSMLRQEVYALDGTDKELHPYTVTEQNFTIRMVQPRGSNRHAVFFTHTRESINFHYERNPVDPRVQHALTLEVDDFGNVLKEVAIGYGRRAMIRVVDETGEVRSISNPALEEFGKDDREKQTTTLITYTEKDFTSVVDESDAYRTPLIAEIRIYELTGYAPTGTEGRFQPQDFVWPDPDEPSRLIHVFDREIPYEASSTGGRERRLVECVRTYYRSDDLGASVNDPDALLPLGKIESLALPGETYRLAFTPGLIEAVFRRKGELLIPDPFWLLGGQGPDRGGYVDLDSDGHWWIPSGRIFYSPDLADTPLQEMSYARQHFFLPFRFRNPFGQTNRVRYDEYDLLVEETRDPLGNTIRAENDYRMLQPWQVTDPNGNRSEVAFDALGMVVGTAVMGKPEEGLGDSLEGFQADLTETEIRRHLADPLRNPHALLQRATTRLVYDFFAYQRTKSQPNPQPSVVYTLARETHESDLLPGEQTNVRHSFSYSDGFGREIQKKIQAEPGPVPERDATDKIIVGADGQPVMTPHNVSPRWVGSGWTVFNNKGKPVRKYEPFFTDTHLFEFAPKIGVSPVLFYDPVERVVATLHPDHTWEKVVFDPWRQETWDVNDTVLLDPATDPNVGDFFRRLPEEYLPTWYSRRIDGALGVEEQKAAQKTAIHAGTPTVTHFDALGRAFLTVAHNRFQRDGESFDEKYETRTELDIEGNTRAVMDAKGRVVMRYDYHMAQPERQEEEDEEDRHDPHLLHQASMEAGERWMLSDVAGNPIRAWDSRGFTRRMTYDELRRPTGLYVTENGVERLVERIVYGESQGEVKNHRTRVYQQFDQAGVVTSEAYDFKGNLLHSTRQLAREYKTAMDWAIEISMEAETYESRTSYDALNRPLLIVSPDHSVIRHTFNEANLLEKVDVMLHGATAHGQPLWTPFVTNIDYDAKGQRTRIDYGNGVSTFYAYDPLTFRLMHLETRRNPVAFPGDCPQPPAADWPGCQVQDLHYTYDPAGNITCIRDEAQQAVFFRNKRVEPSAEYTYDALYRLIEATGREHLGQNGRPISHSPNDAKRINLPHPGDGNAMGCYLERYIYDEVGNFLSMQHQGSDPSHPGWTRTYAYNEPSLIEPGKVSNRLSCTQVGNGTTATSEVYTYDAHGNMTSMPHLSQMDWDFNDQLQSVDLGGGGTAYYLYDASGERVRKVVERQNGILKEERIYFGGFEIYRRYNGSGTTVKLERETLHIMDDKDRIALVETRTRGDDDSPQQLIRYQFGNHLGSVSLELDDDARIISYEEYSPYGSTVYQAVSKQIKAARKRYRFTGKERDEETGLNYHSARYYAPWLGRWTSCDPEGLVDGVNIYKYSMDNPVRLFDKGGRNSSFWNKVGNFFHGIGSKIKSVFNNIGRGIGNAAKSFWNWVIAPSIRTFTNAWIGGLLFGPIGFVGGLVSGAIHGWAMAKAHTYNWSSLRGWLSFIVDNTWSLPNSFAASIWTATNFIFGNKIDYPRSFHSTALVFKRGLIPGYDTTIGNVIAGSHDETFEHEMVHVFQARLFGPLYLPTVALNYALFFIVPVWRLWDKKEIRSFRGYLERIYRNVWNEKWAYSVTGRHPVKNTYNKSGRKNAHHPTRRYHPTNTNNAQNNHSLNCVHCVDILYKPLRISDFKGKREKPFGEPEKLVLLKLWPTIRF